MTTSIFHSARPKQWIKNLLVLIAPAAAGVLDSESALVNIATAFVAFCLVSSGTYLLNDARDAEEDREHPTKQHRPIAAGAVPIPVAITCGLMLLVGGLLVAYIVSLEFLAVAALYVFLTVIYTLWLRRVVILDIALVAMGFIVRALGGAVAVDVPVSRWFLIVTVFGSLFIVAGKRSSEHIDLGAETAGVVRPTHSAYPENYLRYVWALASTVTVTAYCLWSFEQSDLHAGPWYELSIAPFILGVLRYALILERGDGAAPEEVILHDRGLQIAGLTWVLLFGCAIYIGS